MKSATPRPIYKDLFVMEFNVINKQVFYKISKWNDEGTILAELQKAKLGEQDPKQILDKALQLFSTVSSEVEK